MADSAVSTGNIDAQGSVIVGHHNQIITNLYHSVDWQRLVEQRDKLISRVKKYPDEAEFRQELAEVQQQMEDFKRDVLKLAEEIGKIPLNTERLQQAVGYFKAGEYDKARVVLDAAAMTQEQDALLQRQQDLQDKQAEVQQQLDDKAEEFLLKAQLTAIDYSLGDKRIATTSHYFEQAIKSGRTSERLFDYATFLAENNQREDSETLYREALNIYCLFPHADPVMYLSNVAMILNNLGNLVADDTQRGKEAETFYAEALSIRRTLAQTNPDAYLPYVATTLNNLGSMVAADRQRRKEAEILYTEALSIRRTFAQSNPTVYLPNVAATLNNLGVLVAADTQRRKEAETLYMEALSIRRTFAQSNPAVYLPYVATTLNNLGHLIQADIQRRMEAETFYTEALSIRLTLSQASPAVYLPDVATTLTGFSVAYLQWGEPQQAYIYLQEAADIMQPLAEQYPGVHGSLYDVIMEALAMTDTPTKSSK